MEQLAREIKTALNSGVSRAGIKKAKRVVVKRAPKKKCAPLSDERTKEVLSPDWQAKFMECMLVLGEGMKNTDEDSFMEAQYKLMDQRKDNMDSYVTGVIESRKEGDSECRWYSKLKQLHASPDNSFGTCALFLKEVGMKMQRERTQKLKREIKAQVMAAAQ